MLRHTFSKIYSNLFSIHIFKSTKGQNLPNFPFRLYSPSNTIKPKDILKTGFHITIQGFPILGIQRTWANINTMLVEALIGPKKSLGGSFPSIFYPGSPFLESILILVASEVPKKASTCCLTFFSP